MRTTLLRTLHDMENLFPYESHMKQQILEHHHQPWKIRICPQPIPIVPQQRQIIVVRNIRRTISPTLCHPLPHPPDPSWSSAPNSDSSPIVGSVYLVQVLTHRVHPRIKVFYDVDGEYIRMGDFLLVLEGMVKSVGYGGIFTPGRGWFPMFL